MKRRHEFALHEDAFVENVFRLLDAEARAGPVERSADLVPAACLIRMSFYAELPRLCLIPSGRAPIARFGRVGSKSGLSWKSSAKSSAGLAVAAENGMSIHRGGNTIFRD